MANLDLLRKDVQLVINFPINASFNELDTALSSNGYTYAYIMHDKDIHECDVFDKYDDDVRDMNGNILHHKGDKKNTIKYHKGDLKTKHLHLVISSLKRHQLKYYIYQLCEILNIKENQVSVLPSDSIAYSIQYLIHKNDKEKYQYNVTSIRTNLSEGNLFDYLNEDTFRKLTTEDIVRLCVESGGNRVRIIETLGIARYTLYRNTITDILNTLGYYNKI